MQIVTVDVPCTPLASSAAGYCGDEYVRWISDAILELLLQNVQPDAWDHVICERALQTPLDMNCHWHIMSQCSNSLPLSLTVILPSGCCR